LCYRQNVSRVGLEVNFYILFRCIHVTELTACKERLYKNICIESYSCQFRESGSNTFPRKYQVLEIKNSHKMAGG